MFRVFLASALISTLGAAAGFAAPPAKYLELGTTCLRHGDRILQIFITPDDRSLITTSCDHTIRVWDASTGRQVVAYTINAESHVITMSDKATFAGPLAPTRLLFQTAFLPATMCLRIAFDSSLYNLHVGSERSTIASHWHVNQPLIEKLSADGTLLAQWCHEGRVDVISTDKGMTIASLGQAAEQIIACEFTPDGRHLLYTTGSRTIRCWNVAKRSEVWHVDNNGSSTIGIPQDRSLVGTVDKERAVIYLWNTATGQLVQSDAIGVAGPITALAFSPDNRTVCVVEPDEIVLWDFRQHRRRRTIVVSGLELTCVRYSRSGEMIAGGSAGGSVHLWRINTGDELVQTTGHLASARSIAVSPLGERLASVSDDGTVKVWDSRNGSELKTLRGADGVLASVKWTTNGERIIVVGDHVTTWNSDRLEPASSMKILDDEVAATKSELSQDGNSYIVRIGTRLRVVHGALSHEPVVSNIDGIDSCAPLSLSADGQFIVTSQSAAAQGMPGQRALVRLLETAKGSTVKQWYMPTDRVDCLSMTPDTKMLAVAGQDGISLWEMCSGRERAHIRSKSREVSALRFSPNGRFLAWGCRDGRVYVTALEGSDLTATFAEHRAAIRDLAFPRTSEWLASASDDTRILIWNLDGSNNQKRDLVHETICPGDLARLWRLLVSEDARASFGAMIKFTAHPNATVDYFRAHLMTNARTLAKYVGDLDSDEFDVRERAMSVLQIMASVRSEYVAQELTRPHSLEARRRLANISSVDGDLVVRRVTEVLERIGTSGSARLLQQLTDMRDSDSRLREEAAASVGRLKSRGIIPLKK